MTNLAALTTKIECQEDVAADLPPTAVEPVPPTVTKEDDFSDTAVPGAHVKVSKNVRTSFATIVDVMEVLCNVYNMAFCQLTESHIDGDGSESVQKCRPFSYRALYNGLSEAERANSEHDIFTQEDLIDTVELV